jgi:hypothetical protein
MPLRVTRLWLHPVLCMSTGGSPAAAKALFTVDIDEHNYMTHFSMFSLSYFCIY